MTITLKTATGPRLTTEEYLKHHRLVGRCDAVSVVQVPAGTYAKLTFEVEANAVHPLGAVARRLYPGRRRPVYFETTGPDSRYTHAAWEPQADGARRLDSYTICEA